MPCCHPSTSPLAHRSHCLPSLHIFNQPTCNPIPQTTPACVNPCNKCELLVGMVSSRQGRLRAVDGNGMCCGLSHARAGTMLAVPWCASCSACNHIGSDMRSGPLRYGMVVSKRHTLAFSGSSLGSGQPAALAAVSGHEQRWAAARTCAWWQVGWASWPTHPLVQHQKGAETVHTNVS